MVWKSGSIALLVSLCAFGPGLNGAERAITVGLVMDDSTRTEREPLRAYLTQAMGEEVVVDTQDTFQETVARIRDGDYDFACLGALMYIRAREQYGVVPLVQRVTDLQYHTVFIAGVDANIYSLSDLRGKRFAFGDIDSTSAHLMALYELKRAGINPERDLQFRYSGSHPATAALVALGVADAGAIDETVFKFLIARGKIDQNKVRVFFRSRPYVDYVWVARKDVPPAEREQFVRALLALKEGKDDRILQVLRAHRFVVARDQEYNTTRQIAHELKMF